MPLSLGLFLGMIGLFFLFRKSYTKAKVFLSLSFIWIIMIAYNPFANFLSEPLESKYAKLEQIPKEVEYILLLGGDFQARAYEVLRLYNKRKDLKIITSGYEGSFDTSAAILNKKFLVELGIPKNVIIPQSQPRDTKEEVMYTQKIVGDKSFILVTSASHMDRAFKLFKKAGLNPIAAPADLKKYRYSFLSRPSGVNMAQSEKLWHEYIGLIWYKLKGDI